ncbi:MAG: hypothetical protein WBL37_03260 [Dehalococcoidales bacterium]
MRPSVQVWTSYFWKSPFDEAHARDLRRAIRDWRGENRVYLDRDAKEVVRWTRDDQKMQVNECVIPSETTNCFVISHIDGLGRIYPYLPLPKEWHNSVSGSYIRWLDEKAKIYLINSEYRPMPMPVIKDGKFTVIKGTVKIRPGAITPDVRVNEEGVMEVGWRGAGHAKMLAPTQEVAAVFGKAQYERHTIEGQEMLLAVSEKDPNLRGISTEYGWNKPFNYMFGEGAGVDLAMHQGIFNQCIRDAQEGKIAKATAEAETWLGALTSKGKTSLWHSWFSPMAQSNTEDALFAVESQYNISANSMKELLRSEEFRKIMNKNVDVIVAHDWLGYMWWEFYQDLQEKVTIKYCELCGQVIRGGHSDRRFCNQRENPDCYQKRNTINQRKKRNRKP